MAEDQTFASRIREHYPEGLTGVLVIGGTRTSFILDHNRNSEEAGSIPDYAQYMDHALGQTLKLIGDFFDLGGQNLVVALFSYQGFEERGQEYAAQAANMCLRVINDLTLAFYRDNEIDPYFAGIDTLLHLPEDSAEYQLGARFVEFQKTWAYQPGRRKIIWEVAPIPLFSFWKAHQVLGEQAEAELAAQIESTPDMGTLYQLLYKYYARAAYGTDIPMPHFYLGTNRNGDVKLRAMLPISLVCGGPFRLFYVPYPSLFMTRETWQAVLEDLAFGKPMRSFKADYTGQFSSDLVEAEYQRVTTLSVDPLSTIGLTRITHPGDSD